ncbi:ribonuclease Z [Polystyrenella longa]|uniref:Ribonuclease Z n=1 Tax=Polystyrenella longa TaxID=2528007 RepID=A0A518CLX8_9PLAN|nr:MBL fold metallo-hydrolase [Polystyrenella longa]QDU80222.1 ribonuclease Z [Polystyrenella longa]
MKLVCLGTGGYFPNDRRHTAGYLFPELGILFDAGSSAYRVIDCLQTDELDIFLSHAHLDHIVGLTFLLVPMHRKKIKTVRVHARAEDILAIKQHLLASQIFPVDIPFEYHEITGTVDLGKRGKVSTMPLRHPGGSLGYRIDWLDKSFAYITDTSWVNDYLEFVRGVDLLLHECYFPDGAEDLAELTGHSCTSQVTKLAKQAEVKHLGLIHIDPFRTDDDPIGIDAAQAIFPNTFVAEDNDELDF